MPNFSLYFPDRLFEIVALMEAYTGKKRSVLFQDIFKSYLKFMSEEFEREKNERREA